MFLRFATENHRSLRAYTELSWVSTAQQDAPTWRMPATEAPHGMLPVLGLYGANASGKSNLLDALVRFRDLVATSFTELAPDAPVPWTPWCTSAEPTRVDVDVLVEGVRHHYGFRWDRSGFIEEWLYAWPRGRRQVLFHRDHTQVDSWYFGPELGGSRAEIRKATRRNALYLSTAAQYAHEQLTPVWRALARPHVEAPITAHGTPLFAEDAALLDENNRDAVLRLLGAADLGVVDLRAVPYETRSRGSGSASRTPPPLAAEDGRSYHGHQPTLLEVWLTHASADGSRWELAPELESRGTHALLSRLNEVLAHLASGGLMVVDELDTSLHPDLCGALVDLFTDARSNPRGAQLVFSTHDRSLLARLRRDEVVLLDKGLDGGTVVRTASDFKGLRARDALAVVHAEGRIGGVPVLGDLRRIVGDWHGQDESP